MNELIQKLLDAATSAGGKTTYPEFYATLTDAEKRLIPRAIKQAKANGTLKSYITWDEVNKTNIHHLERVVTP
jgi:hypothetical protein